MKTDMTQGKPVKVLLGFTIPVFIGNVFQHFYNMLNAVELGKFVGSDRGKCTDPDSADLGSDDSSQHDRYACTSEIYAYAG